ncbi:hypothetical protein [Kovacikia minuta]|nr:hypothetical protein [Kovacikia minuta]
MIDKVVRKIGLECPFSMDDRQWTIASFPKKPVWTTTGNEVVFNL